jgi:hypothetical protein
VSSGPGQLLMGPAQQLAAGASSLFAPWCCLLSLHCVTPLYATPRAPRHAHRTIPPRALTMSWTATHHAIPGHPYYDCVLRPYVLTRGRDGIRSTYHVRTHTWTGRDGRSRARTHRWTAAKQVAKLQAVAVEFTVVSLLITHTRACDVRSACVVCPSVHRRANERTDGGLGLPVHLPHYT